MNKKANGKSRLKRVLKPIILLAIGTCCLACALGLLFFSVLYLREGAGLQVFGVDSGVVPLGVLIGLVHFLGFGIAVLGCFAIGIVVLARGVVSLLGEAEEGTNSNRG
jgi:hypothetical protein